MGLRHSAATLREKSTISAVAARNGVTMAVAAGCAQKKSAATGSAETLTRHGFPAFQQR